MIDILMNEECSDSDSSVVTYNWVKHKKGPVANFNVEHQCRNWEALETWSGQHQLSGPLKKPPGATELDRIP